jgi:hypothetical protein
MGAEKGRVLPETKKDKVTDSGLKIKQNLGAVIPNDTLGLLFRPCAKRFRDVATGVLEFVCA